MSADRKRLRILLYGQKCQQFLDYSDLTIVAIRDEAVCILTCDGRGIWITHVRRPKKAADPALWPKVPAVFGLLRSDHCCNSRRGCLHTDLRRSRNLDNPCPPTEKGCGSCSMAKSASSFWIT